MYLFDFLSISVFVANHTILVNFVRNGFFLYLS